MLTFYASTPRQFQGIIGQYIEDVTIKAKTPTAAARRYALQLANTSPHTSFQIMRRQAKDKPLRCFKTHIVNDSCAYASVGYVRDDGGKAYMTFEFYFVQERPPVPCDPSLPLGL